MTAGELTVHETTLDGESTTREPFIEAGEGSAFVPRLGEVVFVRCTGDGLNDLKAKAEQLIDKGLHSIVVSLAGLDGADAELVGDVQAHVDRFLGWVCFCEVPDSLHDRLDTLEADRGLELVFAADLDGALALLRARAEAPPSEEGAVEESNDWGWKSSDDVVEDASEEGLPQIEVSELFIEAAELSTLRDEVGELLGRGRVYVTLRLHVARGRRMQSEDVAALSEARDLLLGAGGQLVMVSLQSEFLQWLRLLDEEKNFQIVETTEDATRSHREHAARGVAVLGPALRLASHDGDRFVVRAPEGESPEGETILTGRMLELEPAGLPGLGPRIHSLAEEGVQDVVVDMSRFTAVEGQRFEPVVGAVAAARARGVRLEFASVSHEVRALLKLLHVDESVLHNSIEDAALALAGEVYLRAPFAEATLALARETLSEAPAHQDPVSTIEFESELGELERPQQGAELEGLRAELAQAQGEAARLRDRLEQRAAEVEQAQQGAQDGAVAEREFIEAEQARRRAEAHAEELEQQLKALREESAQGQGSLAEQLGQREQRISQLEQAGAKAVEDLAKARQQVAEAEAEAAAAPVPSGEGSVSRNGDDGDLQARVEQLELEKARILTEAEEEIQRLLQRQERLREELESAGDMIERLGKELELS